MDSSTVDLLLGKIVPILENEVLLVSGVRDEIDKIKDELEMMKSFLKDADRGGVHSETENVWVSKVRDLAYEVEDIIDKFMYNVSKQQQWRSTKYIGFFLEGIQYPQYLLLQRKVAVKLQNVNQRIKNIEERKQRYHRERKDSPSSSHDPNWVKSHNDVAASFTKDDDLVGFTKEKRDLLGWLLNEELQRTVISVVGMGGLGKTTLVGNTFNKQIVKQHFHCYAWITVSRQYGIEELLRSLLKDISRKANEENQLNLNSMAYRELVEKLVEYLKQKRYLIVLDDVWSISFWKEISVVLPNGLKGSRVMLTTREDAVAYFKFGVVNYTLRLKRLRDDEARKLFCMRAFPSEVGQCPQNLDSLATSLVERCGGLPLALVTLGGLMSSKESETEWEFILKNLNWELSNNPELEAVKYIPLLSYHHLPYRLKQCFLYCCVFPEDYPIMRNRLIRLWMAEGFVEPIKGVTPEEVAERYLMELISRGLLQVARRSASGRPRICKMHDILRELAVSISEKEKFVAKSDGKEEAELESNGIRRLSIEARDKEMKAINDLSQLRSLFVFVVDKFSKSSFDGMPSGFKMLRVLDLEDSPINQLPNDLVNLFNLRCLNLSRTQVTELPKAIGNLCNLQSLLLAVTKIRELPPGIVKLKHLRHLIVYDFDGTIDFDFLMGVSVPPPSNLFLLRSLQILNYVDAGDAFLKELSRMTQLRKLAIANVKEGHERDLCFSISKLSQLRYLFVKSCNDDEPLKMDALISPPTCLEKLTLDGKLEKLPHWFNSLQNLKSLALFWSRLREDFLAHIQALPNLGRIILHNAYVGEQLFFLEGFQRLKILEIYRLPQLKEIAINEGAMPGLQQLRVINCPELMTFPHVWDLPDLKEVKVERVPSEIMQKIAVVEDIDDVSGVQLSREDDEWWYSIWRH